MQKFVLPALRAGANEPEMIMRIDLSRTFD